MRSTGTRGLAIWWLTLKPFETILPNAVSWRILEGHGCSTIRGGAQPPSRWKSHAAAVTCALLVLVCAAQNSLAHQWYPKECCNDQDCFPATKVERLPDQGLRVELGHITVIVPPGFDARPSQDNKVHVCVYRDIRGHYHPRCVFLPGVG